MSRLQIKVKGQISKAAFFFEITENGYFVLSPDEAIYAGGSDADRIWLVAILRNGGGAYGLYGFPQAADQFHKLGEASRLAVQSEADAQSAALLYFRTVEDPHGQTLALDARPLKRSVEGYFDGKLPEVSADSKSARWWRGFKNARLSDQLGVRATEVRGGYAASITYLRSVDGGTLQLLLLELSISESGACEGVRTRILYSPADVARRR